VSRQECVPKSSSALIREGNRLTLTRHDRAGLLHLVGDTPRGTSVLFKYSTGQSARELIALNERGHTRFAAQGRTHAPRVSPARRQVIILSVYCYLSAKRQIAAQGARQLGRLELGIYFQDTKRPKFGPSTKGHQQAEFRADFYIDAGAIG
jgi:hypothetical protein